MLKAPYACCCCRNRCIYCCCICCSCICFCTRSKCCSVFSCCRCTCCLSCSAYVAEPKVVDGSAAMSSSTPSPCVLLPKTSPALSSSFSSSPSSSSSFSSRITLLSSSVSKRSRCVPATTPNASASARRVASCEFSNVFTNRRTLFVFWSSTFSSSSSLSRTSLLKFVITVGVFVAFFSSSSSSSLFLTALKNNFATAS